MKNTYTNKQKALQGRIFNDGESWKNYKIRETFDDKKKYMSIGNSIKREFKHLANIEKITNQSIKCFTYHMNNKIEIPMKFSEMHFPFQKLKVEFPKIIHNKKRLIMSVNKTIKNLMITYENPKEIYNEEQRNINHQFALYGM